MSIHYLLDGYNILPQMKVPKLADLEEERNCLIRFIENKRPQGSVNNPVTVVFDGQSGLDDSRTGSASVKIVFSQDRSADDEIKAHVSRLTNAKNCVVVTDDRDIQYAVRALGARVISVRDFLDLGREGKPGRPKDKVSYEDAARINTEMSDVWLNKNKRRKKAS